MKYVDEYRDNAVAQGLLSGIRKRSDKIGKKITIMEVCGSHTTAIGHYGIRGLLPENIRLVSGPGCPVCVTSIHDVDIALYLANQKNIVFTTFGDMLRVPGTQGRTLQQLRAAGADIRVIASPADCCALAEANATKEVIFMGIGFETTSPTVASVVMSCNKKGIQNFSVFSVHKRIPPAIEALINDPQLTIDGFLCPGHVSIMIGTQAYRCITDSGRAAVVAGFEPVDVLEGIFMILGQIIEKKKEVLIQYSRAVHSGGNPKAMALLDTVFYTAPAAWRGLGEIPGTGLFFRDEYKKFDALKQFEIPAIASEEIRGCRCGDILRGIISPHDCPLFKKVCTPANPGGPCMVSSEGTCAVYYKYH
ncbi:MAG: hydrogenase formation protein HypD [Pseudomonadota bacterium]